MDRRTAVPAAAIGGITVLLLMAAVASTGGPVSDDPGLLSFDGHAEGTAYGLTPVEEGTVGPWQVSHGWVFPAEALSILETDALVLDPVVENGTETAASLSQQVTLPEHPDLEVRLRARNAAILGSYPITYFERYCADTEISVSVRAPNGTVLKQMSRPVNWEETELRMDAARFGGRTVRMVALARHGPTSCGTDRNNIAYISYFAVERG